ncbi:hypothetical protein MF672_012420 [Actinomadura sp. ATCC 31491]|uniref:Uncharacterized protein n=1 Tax=Actinomadura luzonensis TaxID=2805427 RepID=A0ABT0FQN3_9ACTN|nr:hypothetical protein [Actinomadura luzonensis]MCK2214589.1 hypothetical protein [Actinomadura luzonensis]
MSVKSRTALAKRLTAVAAAAVATGAVLAGPARAAGEDLQVTLRLCTIFANNISCAQDYVLDKDPVPAGSPFRRNYFLIHRPNSVVQSNFNVQVFRNDANGPVIAQTKSVLLIDQQTGKTLASATGPLVTLAPNVSTIKNLSVSEPSNPSQANSGYQITWHK